MERRMEHRMKSRARHFSGHGTGTGATKRSASLRWSTFIAALLLVSSLPLGLGACGGGVADDSRSELQKSREKLETRYRKIQGGYEGVIEASDGADGALSNTKFRLSLYVDYRDDGVDPEGNPKFLPVLLGRFQLPDVVGENDNERLKADFDEINGQIIFTRAGGGSGGGTSATSSAFSMTGVARGEEIRGEVVRNGGVWGRFTATRVSETASAPAGGEDEEERRRRRRIFESIVGTYSGVVDSPGVDYAARLTLSIIQRQSEGPSGQKVQLPFLMARFSRGDSSDAARFAWVMSDVTFNAQTGAIVMATNDTDTSRTGSTAAGGGVLTGDGSVGNGRADIEFVDSRSTLGRFRGTR